MPDLRGPADGIRRPIPIVLVGAPGSGKSALLGFLTRESAAAFLMFDERYVPTEKSHFIVHVVNPTTSLQIWEATGRSGIGRSILLKSKCCVLVVDLSARETFDELDVIYERFKVGAGKENDKFPCVLVGTKLDLCFACDPSQVVSLSEMTAWAQRKRALAEVSEDLSSSIKVFQISCRTGSGIRPLVEHLASLDSPDNSGSPGPSKAPISPGSAYGGSQLSYTSFDSSQGGICASPLSLSLSLSGSGSGMEAWPFSDLARRAYGIGSPAALQSPASVSLHDSTCRSSSSSSSFSRYSPNSNIGGDDNGSVVLSEGGGSSSERDRDRDECKKILIIGAEAVGKTSILHSFTSSSSSTAMMMSSTFPPYEPTVGTDCREANYNGVKMQLWDTSGSDKMLSLGKSIFKNAKGLVLVFDVARRATLDGLDKYYNNFEEHRHGHGHGQGHGQGLGYRKADEGVYARRLDKVVLVGFKSDLRESLLINKSDFVKPEHVAAWLRSHALPDSCYLEASFTDPSSIKAVFGLLTSQMMSLSSSSSSNAVAREIVGSPTSLLLPKIDVNGSGSGSGSGSGKGKSMGKAKDVDKTPSGRKDHQRIQITLPPIRGAFGAREDDDDLKAPVTLDPPEKISPEKTCLNIFQLGFWT